MKYLLIYLLIINALGFGLMHRDKVRARKNRWRIPERTLMAVAALGGSLGSLLGMYAFWHKTRHRKFTLGLPAILMVQVAGLLYWVYITV